MTDQGPPVRGDVSTDLEPGLYSMRADPIRQLWVFGRGQVKVGLRFTFDLVGVANPFTLQFPPKISMMVLPRSEPGAEDPVLQAKKRVLRDVPQDMNSILRPEVTLLQDAFQALDDLTYVSLYDAIDELWINDPGVVNSLLISFEKVEALHKEVDMYRILQALEAFAVPKKELYVDAFDDCEIDK